MAFMKLYFTLDVLLVFFPVHNIKVSDTPAATAAYLATRTTTQEPLAPAAQR